MPPWKASRSKARRETRSSSRHIEPHTTQALYYCPDQAAHPPTTERFLIDSSRHRNTYLMGCYEGPTGSRAFERRYATLCSGASSPQRRASETESLVVSGVLELAPLVP
ncbi:hypothetical protein cyc_00249 [Cyclospora cayetanensis]|uniref:Uncharacterized protein n=1 Tax=Cyclospora cayetanensis TaxID=88456 RepID=A0A1D3D9P5_9EIME|nr:hypothetical protein cyc_00249 [Cyclospora cayetanensis]